MGRPEAPCDAVTELLLMVASIFTYIIILRLFSRRKINIISGQAGTRRVGADRDLSTGTYQCLVLLSTLSLVVVDDSRVFISRGSDADRWFLAR